MAPEEKKEKKEIRQLLLLLSSAIGVAIFFSVFMIQYYGSTGDYLVKNVLLSPETAKKLDFYDGNHQGKFTFDRAEFRYFDDETMSWKVTILDETQYQNLFDILQNESSLTHVDSAVIGHFNLPNPATLTLFVKNDKSTKVFQEAMFVKNDDYFRISLRGDTPAISWVYFYHRKIYDHILHALFPQEK